MNKPAKPRILCLLKILHERSDEEHPLSTTQLIQLLKSEYGVEAYRTTVAADIEQLTAFGVDIYTVHSTQNKYFLSSRLFELPELRLLTDAVESSRFITDKKSRELLTKIGTLTSCYHADTLSRSIFSDTGFKQHNEQGYYVIDAISSAIEQKKKISFQYYQYNSVKQRELKNGGKPYLVSPFRMVWNGDYYYLLGYSDKHHGMVCFRVDRILRQPKLTDEAAVPMPNEQVLNRYLKTTFRMFGGQRQNVNLYCDNSMMNAVIDQFGTDVAVHPGDAGHFIVRTEVAVSPIFFRWVFSFAGKIRILSPSGVRDEYAQLVRQAAAALDEPMPTDR